MNAVLKYPWLRKLDDDTSYEYEKFGAYRDDGEAFLFARQGSDGNAKSLEAQIMDHADAIAYAVHDLSDFYKAGLLDFSSLKKSGSSELDRHMIKNEGKILRHTNMSMTDAKDYIVRNVLWYLDGDQYNSGATHEISQITRDSQLISKLINDSLKVELIGEDFNLIIPPQVHLTINFLKSIIWDYIIMRPQLGTQQRGQIQIISTLFEFYLKSIIDEDYRMLPSEYRDEVNQERLLVGDTQKKVRLAVDLVARLSENQAISIFGRISGARVGSILEYI